MIRSFKILGFCLVIAVLSGCASKPVLLDRETLRQTPVTKIQSAVPVNELQIELSNAGAASGGAGLGLLGAAVGALIDAGVNSSREKSMVDLRVAMNDYDLQSRFNDKLAASLLESGLKEASIGTLKEDDETNLRAPVLATNFTVSGDRLRLIVHSASAYRNSEEKNDVYSKQYYSVHDLGKIGITKEVKKRTAALATKPDELIELIDNGIEEVVTLFIDDFTENKIESRPSTERVSTVITQDRIFPRMQIVEETNSRVLLTNRSEQFPVVMYTDETIIGKRKKLKKK